MSPMGVASRMNIGQILEANLGLCVHVLKLRTCISDSLNGISTEELRTLMSFTYHVVNDIDLEAVFDNPKFSIIPELLTMSGPTTSRPTCSAFTISTLDGTSPLYNSSPYPINEFVVPKSIPKVINKPTFL